MTSEGRNGYARGGDSRSAIDVPRREYTVSTEGDPDRGRLDMCEYVSRPITPRDAGGGETSGGVAGEWRWLRARSSTRLKRIRSRVLTIQCGSDRVSACSSERSQEPEWLRFIRRGLQ
jgi:hypothetical protein